jgi:hypothetical protein
MMRSLPVLVALLALAGCASEPGSASNIPVVSALPQFITGLPGDPPQFGVSGLQPGALPAGYADSNNQSPDVPAIHADQICTLGNHVDAQKPASGDPVSFTVAQVHCALYRPFL